MQALLIAENKLRRMFDCFEEIDSVDDMIGLTEPDDSTDTGTDPDWPDWSEWPDLDPFAAQEPDTSPEESNPAGSSSNPESIGSAEATAASQNTVSGLLSGEEGDTYDY